MDLSYKREATVGTVIIAAIVLFFLGTTWLSGRSVGGDLEDYWKIQFRDAGNLKTSSAVRISGVGVGKVEKIQLVEAGRVLVSVSLPERITPKVDATAKIVPVGFVGDAVVEFDPGDAPVPLAKSKIIIGSQAIGLADRAQVLSDRADSILLGAQAIVNQKTADQLRSTLTTLEGTLKAAQRTMAIYADSSRGPTAELTKTLTSFRQLTTRLDSALAHPALSRTLSRTDTLTSNLAAMTAQLRSTAERLDTLLAGVNRGQGTLGKLATDSGFYYD
ncbi:MAG TPA: MlaD family protein, partial [Gemmatimonadales bacterium]|nr:MlaD family protein [Gemmatimonadales bacterium]